MRIIGTLYENGILTVVVEVDGYYGQFHGDECLIETLLEKGFVDDRK